MYLACAADGQLTTRSRECKACIATYRTSRNFASRLPREGLCPMMCTSFLGNLVAHMCPGIILRGKCGIMIL